jgi:hypothetical protein
MRIRIVMRIVSTTPKSDVITVERLISTMIPLIALFLIDTLKILDRRFHVNSSM